jgi:uncharacterized phage protein (TIGR01671 family)
MREIKFRGYNKFDKKWVYGYGLHQSIFIDGSSNAYVTASIREVFIVDKESAGQYTGCKDVHGKEIYEGDILKCKLYNGDYENYVIVWDEEDACFDAFNKDKSNFMVTSIWTASEIIGNIYENPELLEVK